MQRNRANPIQASIVLLDWASERLESSLSDAFLAVDHEKLYALVEWIHRFVYLGEQFLPKSLSAQQTMSDVISAIGYVISGSDAKTGLISRIAELLQPCLDNPSYCAGLLCSRSFWETFVAYHLKNAAALLAEASKSGAPRHIHKRLDGLIVVSNRLESGWYCYSEFLDRLSVANRHPLYATNYSLLIPQAPRLQLFEPIEQMIVDSTRNPSLLHRMLPRDFERYIARIWEAFGFQVDLTAQSRDGGVDIVCLSSNLGVPFKIAIEAKRYGPERPISVDLVRGFVGANMTLRANKLVYVTTSRYTRDAIEYAASPTLTNLLELRALPDVLRWAEQFERLRLPERATV